MDANRVADERRTQVRVGLLLLAVGQGITALWALLAPRGFYDDFPGGGARWLPGFGPYNEHFVVDVGAGFLALTAALVFAAVVLERRVVQLACVTYLAFAIPHSIYHVAQIDVLSTKDNVLNVATLVVTLAVPAIVLMLVRSPAPEPAS